MNILDVFWIAALAYYLVTGNVGALVVSTILLICSIMVNVASLNMEEEDE